jgi:hypothetical protein
MLIIYFLFYIFHTRPLTEEEIERVAQKRRTNEIRRYYSFDKGEYYPDRDLKSRIKPTGAFYNVKYHVSEFPSVAAGLLKGKKHEWIIIGFESRKRISTIWANKGPNNLTVRPDISHEDILRKAKNENCGSVLFFHNHPNCSGSSDADMASARIFAQILNKEGINLLEFICARGQYSEYLDFEGITDDFCPINDFIQMVTDENDKSLGGNYALHKERIFG